MAQLVQHPVSVVVGGESIAGYYTLERRGRWDVLTVWYRGRSLTDSEIAHEADPGSTEAVAEGLLRRLVAIAE